METDKEEVGQEGEDFDIWAHENIFALKWKFPFWIGSYVISLGIGITIFTIIYIKYILIFIPPLLITIFTEKNTTKKNTTTLNTIINIAKIVSSIGVLYLYSLLGLKLSLLKLGILINVLFYNLL